jgi:20S proteasome alpha/beta subunit
MDDARYSFSLTTFSPSGKLMQINYALNAVAAGATSLGIKGNLFVFFSFGYCRIFSLFYN